MKALFKKFSLASFSGLLTSRMFNLTGKIVTSELNDASPLWVPTNPEEINNKWFQ